MTLATPSKHPIHNLTEDRGHVYVLEFSNGVVKAGKTTRPKGRLREHQRVAEQFSIQLSRSWVSPLHVGASDNERALLRWCDRHGRQQSLRSEYYTGVSYEALLTAAQGLSYIAPLGDLPALESSRQAAEASAVLMARLRPRTN